jgi:hypothetical protein
MKIAEGEVGDIARDGRWVGVKETVEGGARLRINIRDLECLDRINTRLGQEGKTVEIEIGKNEDELILVDEAGVQIPFEEVMKALFG